MIKRTGLWASVARFLPLATALGAVGWFWSGDLPAWHESQAVGAAERADEAWAARQQAPLSLVVDFEDDIDPSALDANAFVEQPLSDYSAEDRRYRIEFASAEARDAAYLALGRDPDVESVDFDFPAGLLPGADDAFAQAPLDPRVSCDPGKADAENKGFPDDPCFRYQWHLGQIGLPQAWKKGQGDGVVVAVIDTGVSRVPDLANTPFVPGYNFVDNSTDASDDHGHGTHVAGTIAQATNNHLGVAGIAFKAKIMPLKVLSARGSGSMGAIAQAIRWAADHGAQVINMSLGGPFPVKTIDNAVKYARNKGVIVIAAAGNDGKGRVSYPAHYESVVAVAATQFDEATTFYSNWGPQIDIAAPGGNTRVDQNGDGKPDGVLQNTILTAPPGGSAYLYYMGTSMASPHAAGVAALIAGAGINKPDAIEEILLTTARGPKSGKTALEGRVEGRVDDHYGAGIIDAGAALARAHGGRGASALGLAAALLFAAGTGRRRRGLGAARTGWLGLASGVILGSAGLFPLAHASVHVPSSLAPFLAPLTEGVPLALSGWLGHGNPLVLSMLLPFGLIAIGLGVPRLRSLLGGFALGTAGLLAALAVANVVDVAFIPDVFDRAYLAVNAVICAGLGVLALRR